MPSSKRPYTTTLSRLSGDDEFRSFSSLGFLLTPRRINAPADYWPQKVLALPSVNAAMHNYVSIYEQQTVLLRGSIAMPNVAAAAIWPLSLASKPSSVSDWLNGRTVLSLENGLRMRIQQILARHRVRRIRNEGTE